MASGRKGLGLGGGLSNLFGDNAVADLNAETSADSISKIAGQPHRTKPQSAEEDIRAGGA